ncbi:conjugative transfer ATPase [Zhongshania marina]|uniref:conjugative transfer ATPase n=1 Tax=Zhongshania marina TaxID=2304603 RepID=UPI001E2DF456|nr:conjugative transfer ATPase [Marortus luteolus]
MGAFISKVAEVFKPDQTGDSEPDTREPEPAVEQKPKQEEKKPLDVAEVKRMYNRPSSFINRLPWYEYQSDSKTFLLDDGISVAAVYDIIPIASEGRSYNWLQDQRDLVQNAIQDSFEEHSGSPWIIQQYAYDDDDFRDFIEVLRKYPDQSCIDSGYTKEYLQNVEKHLISISKEGGLFEDKEVLGANWGGKLRRVKMICYRRLEKGWKSYAGMTPEEELNDTMQKMETSFAAAGIGLVRGDHSGFQDWMLGWFNPRPEMTNGDRREFKNLVSFPDPEDLPAGDDLAESFFFELPKSDAKSQTWTFNGLPHRCVRVNKIRRTPKIGQVAGEVAGMSASAEKGGQANCMLDQLPAGSIVATTIIVTPQDEIQTHVNRINEKAKGESVEAEGTRQACEIAKDLMGGGHKLYRSMMCVYIRGDDLRDLRKKTNSVSTILLTNNLSPVREEDESLGLDAYLFNLPMCYEPKMDKNFKATRPAWSQHLANLSSVFGRHRGTGNAGQMYFNRGGEPLTIDPFNQDDRKKNAHGLVLGPTGAGKSAFLTSMSSQIMAMLRPRLFIIEAGNSFGLLADYFETRGMTVNKVSLKPGSGVTMPPFADAHLCLSSDRDELLGSAIGGNQSIVDEESIRAHLPGDFSSLNDADQKKARNKAAMDALAEQLSDDTDINDDEEDAERDVMGEMEIIATLMITGGEEEEARKLTRADRRVIRDAILKGAEKAVSEGRKTLTEDIAWGFVELSKSEDLPASRRPRVYDMGEALRMFTDGFEGEVFNRPGVAWPDTDVTIVDLGTFAREGYGAQLAISYTSIMMRINNLAEKHQHDSRPIVMLTDEGHIITTNPLLAPFVVKVVKMWRKLGAWWWVATQNMEDFPASAKKMLNMIEWWICLVMPQEEIEEIARFKSLTDEQKFLMLSARKEPKKYTEGVILSEKVEALFRSVPPSIYLSLAMTEKHEKAERMDYMRKFGISEVEAAEHVANMLDYYRGIGEKPADPKPRKAK